MKKHQKVNTGKKLNLEKFQISKIKNPRIVIGGRMDTATNTATKPPTAATE